MRYEILVDRTERPQKCSILPLAYRSDFSIRRFDRRYPIRPVGGAFLLHPDGEALSRRGLDALGRREELVLSAIDCNWVRLERVLDQMMGPLPRRVRIPDGFQSSYRRRNKRDRDPDGGLATIEALFIASAFLGVWDETLLAEYVPAAEFLEINAAPFERHGLGPERPRRPDLQPAAS
jgi:ribosome biogenesis protein Tsr3